MPVNPLITTPEQHSESEYTLSGNGVPVVMLHSSMSTKEQWGRLTTRIENDHKAIAIDLLGYGAAKYPSNQSLFSLQEEAARIDSIVTHLIGEQKFHLAGHSYGGATALRIAYANRERVLSLSLYEPVAFHLLDTEDPELSTVVSLASQVRRLTELKEYSKATQIFVDFWSGEGTYLNLNEAKRALLDPFIPKVSLDFQAGIEEPLGLAEYREINTPTCLIAGRRSPLPTQNISTNLSRILPRVEFHWIDGGHMAPVSHANIVNPIWERFIRSQTA